MDGWQATAGAQPFVGREAELTVLRERLQSARIEHGGLVMVSGEPGVGKTRLVRELAVEARAAGVRVVWGRCAETDWPRPFGPWLQAFGGFARGLTAAELHSELGSGASALGRLLPSLTSPVTVEDQATSTLWTDQDRYRLYEAIVRLLFLAARDSPALLVLDDLHWADRDSLAVLRYAVHALPVMTLLLVGTYRVEDIGADHPLADMLGELVRQTEYSHVGLRGLNEADVARYLALTAGRELPAELVQRIHRDTAGNPFYIREMYRHLVEVGQLGTQVFDQPSADRGVSDDVRHVVRHRFARLPVGAQQVLQIGAACPGGFDVRLVQALTNQAHNALADSIDATVNAGFVRPVAARPGLYRFAHAIVRHAIYDDQSGAQRARLHVRIGEVLERRRGPLTEGRLADLAYHAWMALPFGDAERAFGYAVQAGARAAELLAHAAAAEHYQRALDLLEQLEHVDHTGERRYELLIALGEAQVRAGLWVGAKAAFQQAAGVARMTRPHLGPARGAELFAQAAVALPGAVVAVGVVDDQLVRLLEEALLDLGERDAGLRAKALSRLAAELYFSPNHDRRLALCREGLQIARRLRDPSVLAYTLECAQFALWGPASVQERLSLTEELQRLAQQLGDRELAGLGFAWRVTALLDAGDWPSIETAMREHEQLTREWGNPIHRWHAAMWAAMRALIQGRYAAAADHSARMVVAMRQTGDPDADLFAGIHTFIAVRDQGGLEALEPSLREQVDQYPELTAVRSWLALLYAELGQHTRARAEFERLARAQFADLPQDLTFLAVTAFLAEVCTKLDDAARAARLYELLAPYRGRLVWFGHGVACFGTTERLLGCLAGTLGNPADAAVHFEAAIAQLTAMSAGAELARTRIDYARLLLSGGTSPERARAQALLDLTLATAGELNLAPLRAQAETLRGAYGQRATQSAQLTPRERDVISLIARGLTNRQIAEALVIGERTVEMHVGHIFTKLGLPSRTAVALWVIQQGSGPG